MRYLPPVIFLLLLILGWDLVVRFELVSAYLLPAPVGVFRAFIEIQDSLFLALKDTLQAALSGLALSLLVGLGLALLFQFFPLLEKALMPFAVFFQTVPVIAIAPLLVIWFGFGIPTVRASAFIVSLFPILANTLIGFKNTPRSLVELFTLYRAKPLQKFIYLTLPSSIPYFLAGLKVASGLAIVGAIVGEFIGGGGLGSLIDSARTQQRTDIVFAAVILSSSLGLIMVTLTDILRWLLMTKMRLGKTE
jgi:NitT/TauT family transport system permease protein